MTYHPNIDPIEDREGELILLVIQKWVEYY